MLLNQLGHHVSPWGTAHLVDDRLPSLRPFAHERDLFALGRRACGCGRLGWSDSGYGCCLLGEASRCRLQHHTVLMIGSHRPDDKPSGDWISIWEIGRLSFVDQPVER